MGGREGLTTEGGYIVSRSNRLATYHIEWDRHSKLVRHSCTIKAAQASTCVHLGNSNGELVRCKSCQGVVNIKLFACSVHGRCSTHNPLDGIKCCAHGQCADYQTPP